VAREKTSSKSQYGEVVARLSEIVQALETGDLSLEDSLDRFAEGIRLVKEGEGLLADAEKRIEQLLSDDGRTAPLDLSAPKGPALETEPAARQVGRTGSPRIPSPPNEDADDIPF
jgi:exodeoxyribonuclease VII small subunit